MEKRNILIFSLAYYPYVWWAEVAWKEITDRIELYEFDIIVAKMDKKLPRYEKIWNIHIYRVGCGNKFIDKILYCLIWPIKWYILNKKRNYKIHIGLMASYWWLAAFLFRKISGKSKYLLNLQDGDTDEYIERRIRWFRWLYSKIFSWADHISTIAKFLEKRARTEWFNGSISLIPNWVDIERFAWYKHDEKIKNEIRSRLWLSAEDIIIISTSRLNYKNAIDDVIQSLQYLDKKYKFVCLWEWEERAMLEEIIKKYNLTDRVILFGYVDHWKMLDYLSIWDFFCRPSLQEGLWNSFLEAMAFWIPTIGTPVWWIVDFLVDWETGYFCAVRDPESIARAIQKFEQWNTTQEIIDKAKDIVIQKYNWDTIAKKYTHLFNTL